MRSSIALIATLLLATLTGVPSASAGHGPSSCTTTADPSAFYVFCDMYCHLGDYLIVSAEGAPGMEVNVNVECGGVRVGCIGVGSCADISTDPAGYDDSGSCTTYGRHSGTCEADMFPRISRGSISSPSHDGGTLSTPTIDECLPSDVVCVGPIEPIPIADVPPVESIVLVPSWSLDADLTRRDPQPTYEGTTVGPIVVTGPPVPIVVCASTCNVPHPSVSNMHGLAVTVTLGSESETVTVLP